MALFKKKNSEKQNFNALAQPLKESTLDVIESEDIDEDNFKAQEQPQSQETKETVDNFSTKIEEKKIKSIDEEKAQLLKQIEELEKIEAEQQKQKEQQATTVETDNYQDGYYQPQLVYMNDSECLREILRKQDLLIQEMTYIKSAIFSEDDGSKHS